MQLFRFLSIVALSFQGVAIAAPDPGQIELVLSQTFDLTEAYTYTYTNPQQSMTNGTIVVARIHPEDGRVRQVGGHVLYIGPVAAERVNNGDKDGHVIAFVPGHVDLDDATVFWGPATLPERMQPEEGQKAHAQATKSAVVDLQTAPHIQVRDAAALYRRLADLIDAYAPGEPERARGFRTQ